MDNKPFTTRSFFQRLLGAEVLAYLLHLRPMEWPIMSGHFLLGTLLASGWQGFRGMAGLHTLLGWFVFVVLLNGGTLAINSAFDNDEGDIGYLKAPPKPPKYLLHVSSFMLAASLGLGFLLSPVFAWSNAACVVMSVLYSVPPVRLKARAGWDLIINMVGFGLLTPLAGWGLTGRPVTPCFWALVAGFALLFGALYPATQIYQIEEDRARGDRTLAIRLGENASLWSALILSVLAHALFTWAIVRENGKWLWLLLSFGAWLVVLLPWCLRWRHMNAKQHEAGMYWALSAWAATDISLLVLLWPR